MAEPVKSRHQTAKQGGSCSANARGVFENIGNPERQVYEGCLLLKMIFGKTAVAAKGRVRSCADAHQDEFAALKFADQSVAFQRFPRVRFIWVIEFGRMDDWIIRACLLLASGKCVQEVAMGILGEIHEPLRSMCMGGSASPLARTLAYDLIVEGTSRAVQVGTPTYLGDLAGLVVGLEQVSGAISSCLLPVTLRACTVRVACAAGWKMGSCSGCFLCAPSVPHDMREQAE